MVTPATRAVVSVRFPFSDLSRTKLRPTVILADVGRDDLMVDQVGTLKEEAFKQIIEAVVAVLRSSLSA